MNDDRMSLFLKHSCATVIGMSHNKLKHFSFGLVGNKNKLHIDTRERATTQQEIINSISKRSHTVSPRSNYVSYGCCIRQKYQLLSNVITERIPRNSTAQRFRAEINGLHCNRAWGNNLCKIMHHLIVNWTDHWRNSMRTPPIFRWFVAICLLSCQIAASPNISKPIQSASINNDSHSLQAAHIFIKKIHLFFSDFFSSATFFLRRRFFLRPLLRVILYTYMCCFKRIVWCECTLDTENGEKDRNW